MEQILKKKSKMPTMMALSLVCISCITAIIVAFDSDRAAGYELLFLLPITYAVMSLVFEKNFSLIPSNLGATLILVLFFIRMVVSPFLLCLGDYNGIIKLNVEQNTPLAIFLMCYECVACFIAIYILSLRKSKIKVKAVNNINLQRYKLKGRYKILLIAVVALLALCLIYTPQILIIYRTIFQITDENFASLEDTYVANKYATTFLKKLSIVTGQYLMRAAILLIPAVCIIICAASPKKALRKLSFLFLFVPFFFISGTIAKSLIYFVVLFMLRNLLLNRDTSDKKTIKVLGIAGIAIMAWWIFRTVSAGSDMLTTFSARINAYFSGVNTVSGTFNLDGNIIYRIRYFLYDFCATIPYGGTIFGISNPHIGAFFDTYNQTSGQIPTTIGMGCYYFGPVFAPIYSVIFTAVAYKSSDAIKSTELNPIRYIRLLTTVLLFSLGVGMYNIFITMTNLFSLIIPLYLLEKLAGIKDNRKGAEKSNLNEPLVLQKEVT